MAARTCSTRAAAPRRASRCVDAERPRRSRAGRRFADRCVTQRRRRVRAPAARRSATPTAARASPRSRARTRRSPSMRCVALAVSAARLHAARGGDRARGGRDPRRAALAIPLAAQLQHAPRRRDAAAARRGARRAARLRRRARAPALPGDAGEPRPGGFAPGGDAANGALRELPRRLPAGGGARPRAASTRRVRCATPGARGATACATRCYGGDAVNGVADALTRANGMQAATLPGLGAAPHYLFVCATGAAASAGRLRARREPAHAPRGLRAALARAQRRRSRRRRAATRRATSTATRSSCRARPRRRGQEFDDVVHWGRSTWWSTACWWRGGCPEGRR